MDIYEFAMEKEMYAEQYYRELAEQSDDSGLKSILTMLADEEAKHYRTVEQMKANAPASLTDSPVLKNAQEIFTKMKDGARTFNFEISEVDLYRRACEIEKRSKQFYLEKSKEVGDSDQEAILRQLAAEEDKHLLLVQRLCDFVARPEMFLEDAEMYHFDDYVEGEF